MAGEKLISLNEHSRVEATNFAIGTGTAPQTGRHRTGLNPEHHHYIRDGALIVAAGTGVAGILLAGANTLNHSAPSPTSEPSLPGGIVEPSRSPIPTLPTPGETIVIPSRQPSPSASPARTETPAPSFSVQPSATATESSAPSASVTVTESPAPTEALPLTREQLVQEVKNFQKAEFNGKYVNGIYTPDSKKTYAIKTSDFTIESNDPYIWRTGGSGEPSPLGIHGEGGASIKVSTIIPGTMKLDDGRTVGFLFLQDGRNKGYVLAVQIGAPSPSDISFTVETTDSAVDASGTHGGSNDNTLSPEDLMTNLPENKNMPIMIDIYTDPNDNSDKGFYDTLPVRKEAAGFIRSASKPGTSYSNIDSTGLLINTVPDNSFSGLLPVLYDGFVPKT